eukprot:gb/GFBE01031587.1/.p1 GENE.gb/GFBE01031587.1/~~gb/GFBE01031587.1/.p1  ORF type:complete len:866 (+),score=210.91 gb/GFBE01031587.1/:1-2598(+)
MLAFAADSWRSPRPVLVRRLPPPATWAPPVLYASSGGASGSRDARRHERQPKTVSALVAATSAATLAAVHGRRSARRRTARLARGPGGRNSSRKKEEEEEEWDDEDMEDADWGDFNPKGARYVVGQKASDDDEEWDDEDEEWDDEEDGKVAMRFSEQDELEPGEDDEEWDGGDEYEMAGFGYEDSSRDGLPDALGGMQGVFDGMEGMDDPMGDDGRSTSVPSADELSLLYDDFPVTKAAPKKSAEEDNDAALAQKPQKEDLQRRRKSRTLETLEEREYEVCAEGIAVRTLPDERSPRTGQILREGERFIAVEAVEGVDGDQRLYLRLPEGKGWVFDDEKIYPGLPSVKLVAVGGVSLEETPEPVKRPLIAVIGRPNVGKSTLVNRICELTDDIGGITHDSEGTTRDRTYKSAEHTDDCGDTFMFDVVDTGGLIFADDEGNVTFEKEIKTQIDTALREAVAAIFVVDSQAGLMADDIEIVKYLKKVYRGVRVVLAVAKSDRLETMDYNAAEFWALDCGEPIPVAAIHRRGIWEVVDAVINGGCNGLFPKKIRGIEQVFTPRDNAINVAICGKPNAGKSSLLNAFIGEERVIVSDIPGTTTDAIDAYLETDEGKVYRFIDTAGIRKKGKLDPGTEWLAVNRAMKAVKRADVAILVLDASEIMTGSRALGKTYWCPDSQMRYIARAIEERGTACVVVLSKWDAVVNKDEKSQKNFIQAIRSNLAGVGQWAEIVTCSAKTGQRLTKVLEAIDKTLEAHRKRVATNVLNEVVRDCLLWRLPPAKTFNSKQGRIYYATQIAAEPPQIVMFCNDPKLFGNNYRTYLENKIRQDLAWFGTPIQMEYRKSREKAALSSAEQWLGPRLLPSEAFR